MPADYRPELGPSKTSMRERVTPLITPPPVYAATPSSLPYVLVPPKTTPTHIHSNNNTEDLIHKERKKNTHNRLNIIKHQKYSSFCKTLNPCVASTVDKRIL